MLLLLSLNVSTRYDKITVSLGPLCDKITVSRPITTKCLLVCGPLYDKRTDSTPGRDNRTLIGPTKL